MQLTKEDWGTIIHGTCKQEDILRALAYFCYSHEIAEVTYCDIRRYARMGLEADASVADDDTEFLTARDYLENAITEVCPAGYACGTHPADGSDVGIWPIEIWE